MTTMMIQTEDETRLQRIGTAISLLPEGQVKADASYAVLGILCNDVEMLVEGVAGMASPAALRIVPSLLQEWVEAQGVRA